MHPNLSDTKYHENYPFMCFFKITVPNVVGYLKTDFVCFFYFLNKYRLSAQPYANEAEQFHSDDSLETVDRRITRKTDRGRWKVTTVEDDRHQVCMVLNDRTASSRQLAARWSTATSVLITASSIRRRLLHLGLRARVPLYRIPLTANHRRLRLQWAHEHRVRPYAGERCLPGCVIERHSGLPDLWFGVQFRIMDDPFCYELRPAYSPDMSPIEHVWDLVGRRLARDPCPAASKEKHLLRIQAIWNSLPQADIQNLFDSMLRRIAALIAARNGYTKY
ncbi:transposable element Tcb2 transposase [Trichonephila clavipes]|nr:transposable element Tcb2 transposase [Trichonephila clavipes]